MITDSPGSGQINSPPAKRIAAIRASLRTFICGVVGVVPVIGFLPAIYALACFIRIRARYGDEWNPASNYLVCGVALALLGLTVSGLGISAVVLIYVLH
jgi:hypothetical protein